MAWLRGASVGSGETNDLEMVIASHCHFLPEQLSTTMARFWLTIGLNCATPAEQSTETTAARPTQWLEVPYLRRIVETVIMELCHGCEILLVLI